MGRFQPGQSGNPGGRPKGGVEVRELARQHTAAAIRRLSHLMENGQSEQAQIMAANSLLDRGWGKPTQSIAGDDNAPLVMIDARAELIRFFDRLIADRDPELDYSGDHREGRGPGGIVGNGDLLLSAAPDSNGVHSESD